MDYAGSLSDKIAVVTGAGSNIGRAIAIGLASAGAHVVCAGRTRSTLDETVAQITASGGSGATVVADITDEQQVLDLMQKAAENDGRIDVVFLNAGGSLGRGRLDGFASEQWRATIELNLTSVFLCAKAAVPYLRKATAPKIITTGSGAGHDVIPEMGAYSVGKAGLWALTRALAKELIVDGICVNELIPGPVGGKLSEPANTLSPATLLANEWRKPPGAVAPLALFLATQPRNGPTGQSFSLMRR